MKPRVRDVAFVSKYLEQKRLQNFKESELNMYILYFIFIFAVISHPFSLKDFKHLLIPVLDN